MSELWSAAREKRWTVVKETCFYTSLGFLVGTLVGMVLNRWDGVVWNLCGLGLVFSIGTYAVVQLKAMEPNRPAGGARGLTQWRFWPHYQLAFDCACGKRLTFENVTFSPNEHDPGGGRFALVCKDCGQGHYKYSIDPRATASGGIFAVKDE